MRKKILSLYHKIGHPTAFSGINNVAKYHGITENQARDVLNESSTYVDFREFHKPPLYNPYYVRRRRDLVQGDLIETIKLKGSNDDITYLLLLIDVFTKYCWCYPLKSKKGVEVKKAFVKWKKELSEDLPKHFSCDSGGEFYNKYVKKFMAKNGIQMSKATSECKAAVVERLNKSIQSLMYKYMSSQNTRRYIDALPNIIDTYLNRPHRTLKGLTPKYADKKENEREVWQIYDDRFTKLKKQKPKFTIGDIVRVKSESKVLSPSKRSYNVQFKPEFYQVRGINNRLAIPLYYLRACADDEDVIGGFYHQELNLVGDDVYKIEKVIGKRVREGKTEALVKWEGFSDSFNDWIPSKNIISLKKKKNK